MEGNDPTSLILNVKRKQDQDLLSAEDLAWADSCLIEDPEISETNLDSLKAALLDILDQHSEILGPSANEIGESNDITDPKNPPSLMEEETAHSAETSTDDEHLENESPDVSLSIKEPFLPNYHDEMMSIQYSDDHDEGFAFSEFVTADDDIFKVWDLDIPVEEDGFVKQLKEALSSNAATRVPRMEGLNAESLDSLVESIADLSLK